MREDLFNIKKKIEELRKILQCLIETKSDMIDPEIVAASEELDQLINTYNNASITER